MNDSFRLRTITLTAKRDKVKQLITRILLNEPTISNNGNLFSNLGMC